MRAVPVALLTTAILAATPAIAFAGSDSPTPYTVTADGVTLPTGRVFHEHDHVNYRATSLDGTGGRDFNVHVENANGRSTAAHVGASSLDFDDAAAAFPAGYCVTWVQVAGFDEHFGEGKQPPVCTPAPATPVTRPAPVPRPVPVSPGVEVPDGEAPVDSPVTEPSPTSSQTPAASGTTPVVTPDDEGLAPTGPAPEATAVDVTDAAPVAKTLVDTSAEAAVAPPVARAAEGDLAATGSNALLLGGGAVVLLAVGVGAVLLSRRARRS